MRLIIVSAVIAVMLVLGFRDALSKEMNNALITGKASWYGKHDPTDPMPHGKNADGTVFNENAFTCAMRSRNFGHYYRITNLHNGKSVIVKHADYGPAKKYRGRKLNRVIDLTKAAFKKISDLRKGVIRVRVERIYVKKSGLL